jgi:enoyl-CoA hydratase/carnithine racemase
VFPPAAAALLPRRANQALADRMILSGEELSATELKAAGLIHDVFAAAELQPRVDAWFAANLARFSASALREAARAARRGFLRDLEQELKDLEHDYLTRLQSLADAHEGIAAFIERRTPYWSHA